jgi:hypothetical protein
MAQETSFSTSLGPHFVSENPSLTPVHVLCPNHPLTSVCACSSVVIRCPPVVHLLCPQDPKVERIYLVS